MCVKIARFATVSTSLPDFVQVISGLIHNHIAAKMVVFEFGKLYR